MVFWSKEGWRVADITLFVKVGEISVRNIRIMIKASKQTSRLSKQQSVAWSMKKDEKRKLPVSKNTMFYFSFDLVAQLEPKADLQEGEFTFQGTFCPCRRPSRVSSLYIYISLHVRKSWFWNPGNLCLWNPESRKKWHLWTGILGFRIQTTAQRIWNPSNDWNPESKFHWQR